MTGSALLSDTGITASGFTITSTLNDLINPSPSTNDTLMMASIDLYPTYVLVNSTYMNMSFSICGSTSSITLPFNVDCPCGT